jgi:hypothetical protein
MMILGIIAAAIFVGAVICLIWKAIVWHKWDGDSNKCDDKLGPWPAFGGAFFFGLLITLVWSSADRDVRGLYNLVEGWGIDRWGLVAGIIVASLVYAGSLRLYCGEKGEEK